MGIKSLAAAPLWMERYKYNSLRFKEYTGCRNAQVLHQQGFDAYMPPNHFIQMHFGG
jgi:hypothetical protein